MRGWLPPNAMVKHSNEIVNPPPLGNLRTSLRFNVDRGDSFLPTGKFLKYYGQRTTLFI